MEYTLTFLVEENGTWSKWNINKNGNVFIIYLSEAF